MELIAIAKAVLDYAKALFARRDTTVRERAARCDKVGTHLVQIGGTLEDLGQAVRSGSVPLSKVSEVAEQATHLKEVMGDDLKLRSIDELLDTLQPAIELGGVVIASDSERFRAADQMEEAAGIFKGLGMSCKIHESTISNQALQRKI